MKNAFLSLMTLGFAGVLYAGAACCPVAGAKDEAKKEVTAEAKKACGETCTADKKDCAPECKAEKKAEKTEEAKPVVAEEKKAE